MLSSYGRLYTLFWLLVCLWCSSSRFIRFVVPVSVPLPGCPSTCGSLTIPYPFGIGTNCAREGFDLNCNHSSIPPKTYLWDTNEVELLNISLLEGWARVRYYRDYNCYSWDGTTTTTNGRTHAGTAGSLIYTFSNLHNKFTVMGCDTVGYIKASNFSEFASGCISVCDRPEKLINGSCSGIGCCQTAIPKGLKQYDILLQTYYNHTKVWDFNPCSYAFLVDEDWFTFNVADLTDKSVYRSTIEQVPVVLDWVAGNESCAVASKNADTFACRSEHSVCYESTSSSAGYLCNCSSGYEGNPYLERGCQDINECERPEVYPCKGICSNTEGGYTCVCRKGSSGDPLTYGCLRDKKPIKIILATIAPSLSGAILIVFMYGLFEKRKRAQLAQKFYQQNGGNILDQHMSTHSHIQSMLKVFTKLELEKATNKFDENKILGRGGQGMVYEGTLPNNTKVAIKKSVMIDGSRIDDFINEILILSQISHRNVVRLLGCCLEVEIPYLVYEFIPNNTLFYHIHKKQLPWGTRLHIAKDVAEALAHLHTKANIPIYHQDVKSTNILLDDDFTAKVSDFGASKLVPTEEGVLNTLVQGTMGYLDPEYLQTHKLTDKSDVYSFGVVLVELLTSREPISYQRSEEEICLAQHFKLCMEDNKLIEILDPKIVDTSPNIVRMQMEEVAKLASRCLKLKGKERPDMMEVCMYLEGLWRSGNYMKNQEQGVMELAPPSSSHGVNNHLNNQSMYLSTGTYSDDVVAFLVDAGR